MVVLVSSFLGVRVLEPASCGAVAPRGRRPRWAENSVAFLILVRVSTGVPCKQGYRTRAATPRAYEKDFTSDRSETGTINLVTSVFRSSRSRSRRVADALVPELVALYGRRRRVQVQHWWRCKQGLQKTSRAPGGARSDTETLSRYSPFAWRSWHGL